MGLPLQAQSGTFSPDQQITFRAHYWDTTSTAIRLGEAHAEADRYKALGSGIEYAQFDLLDASFAPAIADDVEAALAQTAGKTRSVLGYTQAGAYRTGVVPNIYAYWGSGSPLGGSRAKQVVLKYTGYVTEAIPAATLVFAGFGKVFVRLTRAGSGAVTYPIVNGTIREPEPNVDLVNVSPEKIKSEWGYQFSPAYTLNKGDKIDIYYIHNGEKWGGIVGKVYPGVLDTSSDAFLEQVREAAIIGTSFLAKEPQALAATPISYITDVTIKPAVGAVPEMTIEVPVTQNGGDIFGYRLNTFRDENSLIDNADPTRVLKKGRTVHFEGGFMRPVGVDVENLLTTQGGGADQNWNMWSHQNISYWDAWRQFYDPEWGMVWEGTTGAGKQPYIYDYYPYSGINVGDTMTLGFWIWSDTPVAIPNVAVRGELVLNTNLSANAQVQTLMTIDQTPRFVSLTWTAAAATATMGFRVRIGGGSTLPDGGKFYIAKPMFERGAVAHPYVSGVQTVEEVYPRFTGYIEDIVTDASVGTAQIICRGFEGKLAALNDENTPDRIDYLANGYILREMASEPVFPIPAFDNWPLETVTRTLNYKAGIDSYNLGVGTTSLNPDSAKRAYRLHSTGATFFGQKLLSAKSLASQKPITLERQTNYGNVPPLQKDYLPKDDTYLFPPQVTSRLYDRLRQIVDHYGYDFYFNAEGKAVLTGRNNAIYFQYLTQNGAYATGLSTANQVARVSAVGGIVFDMKHSQGGWTRAVEGKFSRLDLYYGIGKNKASGLNGGKITYTVERRNPDGSYSVVMSNFVTTAAQVDEAFYYSDRVRADGSNAAMTRLFSLPLDHYRVTFSPGGPEGGAADCHYRLNGVAVYDRDPEQTYFAPDGTLHRFSTLGNALQVTSESAYKDLRNHVIVVGQRKATVTDSSKLNGETTNPNNPEREFHVAVAADPFSVYDPTSPNFIGAKRMTVIFDDKVNDSDFARWLTRTILYRYRMPKTEAKLRHTILPMLELRDAIFAVEERLRSVEHTVYVTAFTERWSVDEGGAVEAMTDIDASANPEIPSYQPREDVDIDAYFIDPADGKGEPVINMALSYRNLYGQTVTNADLFDTVNISRLVTRQKGSAQPMQSDAITNATTFALSQPAIPETMYLSWNRSRTQVPPTSVVTGLSLLRKRALVNMPYRHFFYVSSWDGAHKPTLTFTFEEADGTTGLYDKTYYQFPNLNSTQWFVNYDYFLPRQTAGGQPMVNPFYDPYTSEIGNLISIKFDALVSGRYRVSIWNGNRPDGRTEIPVAWLTNPGNDPEEPEAHYQFLQPGEAEFVWDASDNIGFWNALMSAEYASEMEGTFDDKPMAVTRGFYAWNDISTNPFTLIGDTNALNFDKDGVPYFTLGQFGQFYVKVEVLNDTLMRKDLRNDGRAEPRTVDSHTLPTTGAWNTHPELYAWTHLGEPTQVGIRIQDWVSGAPWTSTTDTTDLDWSSYSTPDTDATIRDGKPVRVTFVPRPRRGPMWERANRTLNEDLISVKLNRLVSHQGTVFDQFWTLYGQQWEMHSSRSGGGEKKRVSSRMYHTEPEALEFEDQSWRTGESLRNFEWVFDPSLFVKDFGKGIKERLKYSEYLQLTSLPHFDAKKLGGAGAKERDVFLMAFISHVFAFSAHTLDRSGRRQWCLNSWKDGAGKKRGFIDRTKIVTPNWKTAAENPASGNYRAHTIVDYEGRGADRYLARTVFMRQWVEPGWKAGTYSGNPVTRWGISDPHQKAFVQAKTTDFGLFSGSSLLTGGQTDNWLSAYATAGRKVNYIVNYKLWMDDSVASGMKDRSITTALPSVAVRPAAFGTWNFSRGPGGFSPSPVRDFHPYWKYPDMPADSYEGYMGGYILNMPASHYDFRFADGAANPVWFGYAFSDSLGALSHVWHGARLEKSVESVLGVEDPRGSVVNYRDNITAEMVPEMFDYARQDELYRFDDFRGVVSRGGYASRNAHYGKQGYYDKDNVVAAPVAPVKANGTYLLNVARYQDYFYAPVTMNIKTQKLHFTSGVSDWTRIAFAHEYVWYSARHFPVNGTGGAPAYSFAKTEYTGALDWVGVSSWLLNGDDPFRLAYDPGAWTGWKWDLTATEWTATPRIRWAEHRVKGFQPDGTLNLNMVVCDGSGLIASGGKNYRKTFSQGQEAFPANIFDDYKNEINGPRLAVGPEIPEARTMVMNLSLPDRLA